MCVCVVYAKCYAPVCVFICRCFPCCLSSCVFCTFVFCTLLALRPIVMSVMRLFVLYIFVQELFFVVQVFIYCTVFCTFAALLLITQSIMCWLAALAAFSLNIDFAATLSSNKTESNVCHPVTDSSIQGAQRVTVTGYKHTLGFRLEIFSLNRTTITGSSLGPVPSKLWSGLW